MNRNKEIRTLVFVVTFGLLTVIIVKFIVDKFQEEDEDEETSSE